MITERIQAIIRHHGLTASAFADKLGVQRSGMSHIFSGRNKPSLDLVIKILDTFPEISIDWLLKGEGEMQKGEVQPEITNVTSLFSASELKTPENSIDEMVDDEHIEIHQVVTDVNTKKSHDLQTSTPADMEPGQMMLLYPDGTFERYVIRSK